MARQFALISRSIGFSQLEAEDQRGWRSALGFTPRRGCRSWRFPRCGISHEGEGRKRPPPTPLRRNRPSKHVQCFAGIPGYHSPSAGYRDCHAASQVPCNGKRSLPWPIRSQSQPAPDTRSCGRFGVCGLSLFDPPDMQRSRPDDPCEVDAEGWAVVGAWAPNKSGVGST
jgi:hypothetical protein